MKFTPLFLRRGAPLNLSRFMAGLLTVSLFLSPLQIQAEEQQSEESTPSVSTEHQIESEEESPLEGPQMLLDDTGANLVDLGRPSIAATPKLEPNTLDGSLQYEFPLTIPPGRNGLQPALSLTYSSRPGREANLVGHGWSISIPYIERRNYRGSNELFDHAAFYSSLSGELASTSATSTFKAKVEEGDYLNYTFSGNMWTVTDRAGKVYKFGHSSSTQQYHASSTQDIYKWMLQEVRDTNGNYVSYSYTKDANQIYPDVITYTGNGGTPGNFDIHFTKELRADVATSTWEGFQVVTKYRISEIKAEVNDSWVRKYTLAYGSGDNGWRSLLTAIGESGNDGTNVLSLASTTFGYQTASDSWSANNWDISLPLANGSGDNGVRIAEANGDGLPDLLVDNQYDSGVWLNTGTGWELDLTFPDIPVNWAEEDWVHPGSILVDINADGITDFAEYIGGGTSKIYMGTGHGWTLSSSTFPIALATPGGGDNGVRLGDFNGDGLVDMVKDVEGEGGGIFINNGITWVTDTTWDGFPEFTLDEEGADIGTRIVDVNGDGLADVVRSHNSINKVHLNNGDHGWTATSTWVLPTDTMGGRDNGIRFEDLNGDGLIDVFGSVMPAGEGVTSVVYINTGKGWDYDSSWHLPAAIVIQESSHNRDAGTRLADADGDGLVDVLNHEAGESDTVYIKNGQKADLLATITTSEGGRTTMTYKGSAEYGTSPNLPYTFDTVAKLEYDDGIDTWDTDYAYNGGLYYASSTLDRKFAGFASTTQTDDLGFVTKNYFHQGSTTNSSLGEYSDHISKIGKIYRTEVYDDSNNLFSAVIRKWDRYDRGDGATFVKLANQLDLSYDGDNDHKDIAEAYAYNDARGSRTQLIEYGEVTGSDDGTFSDTGSDQFTTSYTYATSTATSSTYYLSQETTLDQSAGKVREKKLYYDTLSHGSLDKGNPTKEERWKVSSTYIDSEKTYNGYGLVTADIDPRDKTTSYVYDSLNLYPATTTNPLSQSVHRLFDYSSGKVATTTDANGLVFATIYDALDRPVAEKQPDISSPSTLVTKRTYAYTDSIVPRRVQTTDHLDGSTAVDSYTYFDGYGRKVEDRVETEGGTYAVRDYTYDARGSLKTESLPALVAGTSFTGTTSAPTSALVTTYAYDPLKRVTSITNTLGATTNTYDQWVATTTDAIGKIRSAAQDAFGNLVRVIEDNGSLYTTNYEYNGNKDLTKITDAEGNVRNFTYDGLNRRLTAQDLHDAGDGTYGTWSYTYDDAGNLTSQTDPKSQVVDFTYDDTNRVVTENYAGSGGTERAYAYDSCTNGIGRLCTATTTDAIATFAYNALGLVASEGKKIDGTTYTTTYAYDRLGNPTTIVYPDSSEVRYTYNSAGQTETVEQKESGGSFSYLVEDFDYSPTGKVAYKEFGNEVSSTYTYDASQLYRLTRIYTIATSTLEGFGGGGMGLLWEPALALARAFPYANAVFEGSIDLGADAVPTDAIVPEGNQDIPNADDVVPTIPEEPTPDAVAPIIEEIATTTPAEPVLTPEVVEILPPVEEVATTTVELPLPTTDHLLFKAPVEQHIGTFQYEDGTVKYAYLTGAKIEDIPMSRELATAAREKGVAITGEMLEKRTSHARTFATSDPTVFITEIISGEPQYYQDEKGEWWQAEYATTTAKSYEEQARGERGGVVSFLKRWAAKMVAFIFGERALATTSTFYPDPNTETSTVDGTMWRANIQESFSTKRNGAGTHVDDSSSANVSAQISDGTGTNWKHFARAAYLFNTASIPDGDTIVSATFSVKRNTTSQNDYSQSISLTSSNPASNTALAASDYSNFGTTLYATDITIASMGVGSYIDWSLNGTGIGAISKTGITKLGLRIRSDIDNSDPGSNGSNNSGSYIESYFAEASGTSNDPKLVVVHSAPAGAPTDLLTEGQTNPSDVTDNTPEFSAIYNDTDSGDIAMKYRLQVATTSTFSNIFWDTGTTTLASSTPTGMRIADISYAGAALASSTLYYWRIKFWDNSDVEGLWSTATSTFQMAESVLNDGSVIQDVTYVYDDVGNITTLTDISDTGSGKVIAFGYDNLHRLTSASTTAASSTPFNHVYSYSSIGNLSSSTPKGAYTYGETGYTNPHAPTSINGTTLGYDANGNLTSYGTDIYGWDYRNRMASSTISGTGTVNGYDHVNQRVIKTTGGISTIYPNKYFDKANATSTKYIWAGDELIATVEGNGSATSTSYIHNDHLGSTNAVTDEGGDLVLSKDYLPFGAIRTETGDSDLARGYIGQFEEGGDMSYLNNRFYESDRGQFTSQDPVFRAVGNAEEIKRLTKVEQQKVLMDPQALNSYSYARNNPIRYSDPEGLWFGEFATGQQSWSDFQIEVGQATQQMTQDSAAWNFAVNHPVTAGALTGVLSAPAGGAGTAGIAALRQVAYPGVGAAYATGKAIAGSAYLYLAHDSLKSISSVLGSMNSVNVKDAKSYLSTVGTIIGQIGPQFAGEKTQAITDIINLSSSIVSQIKQQIDKANSSGSKNKKNNK